MSNAEFGGLGKMLVFHVNARKASGLSTLKEKVSGEYNAQFNSNFVPISSCWANMVPGLLRRLIHVRV